MRQIINNRKLMQSNFFSETKPRVNIASIINEQKILYQTAMQNISTFISNKKAKPKQVQSDLLYLIINPLHTFTQSLTILLRNPDNNALLYPYIHQLEESTRQNLSILFEHFPFDYLDDELIQIVNQMDILIATVQPLEPAPALSTSKPN